MPVTYATHGDFLRAHLKGGPESDRLEFTATYYQDDIDRPESRLIDVLRSDPDAPGLLAPEDAVVAAIHLFHPEFADNHLSGVYKGLEQRYRGAAWLAIQSFQLSPEVEVDALAFDGTALTPASELREVARLAVQTYRVMTSLAETGEVPAL